ncbi:MAG: hypothetical protein FJ098_01145 [Deltaproteobacteria bacterium]|nr:hypothetical protein [Deltaproteobacteria bacterium]
MLRDLATRSDVAPWAVASMVFFIVAFSLVVLRAWSLTREEDRARARLPLEPADAADGGTGDAHG